MCWFDLETLYRWPLADLTKAWSPEKKHWCCTEQGKGCEGSSKPSVDPGAGMVWKHVQASPRQSRCIRLWTAQFPARWMATGLGRQSMQLVVRCMWSFRTTAMQGSPTGRSVGLLRRRFGSCDLWRVDCIRTHLRDVKGDSFLGAGLVLQPSTVGMRWRHLRFLKTHHDCHQETSNMRCFKNEILIVERINQV